MSHLAVPDLLNVTSIMPVLVLLNVYNYNSSNVKTILAVLVPLNVTPIKAVLVLLNVTSSSTGPIKCYI